MCWGAVIWDVETVLCIETRMQPEVHVLLQDYTENIVFGVFPELISVSTERG